MVPAPGLHPSTNGGGAALGSSERDLLIADLRAAPARFSLVITGGGFRAVTDLLTRPGASDIVHDIEIPYHPTAMSRLLPHLEGPAVSDSVAVGLARSALVRMDRDLSGCADPGEAVGHGVGVTAALATDRERRGATHAWVAVVTAHGESKVHLELPRAVGGAARLEQDRLLSDVVLWLMADAVRPGRPGPRCGPGVKFTAYPPRSG